MLKKNPPIADGYNSFIEMNGKHSDMLMDVGVHALAQGQGVTFSDSEKETALLILTGQASLAYQGKAYEMKRSSLFEEKPSVLHVPAGVAVDARAIAESQLLIIKTENPRSFEPVFYSPDAVDQYILGDSQWENTAKRTIRDIFNYGNAPYSNLVVGEIINQPGRWSSYPPHQHPQPEVYYFRFDKPQGFGCSFIGDEVYKIHDNSVACIPGGLTHPQASAPGYFMYYCWIIRHLDNNPWTMTRIYDPSHTWLLEN